MRFREKVDLFVGGVMATGILLFYVVMAVPWIFYEILSWREKRLKGE